MAKQQDSGLFKKVMWFAVLLVIVVGLSMTMYKSLKYHEMKIYVRRLKADVDRLEADNRELTRQIRLLNSNTEYIEQLARERLGLIKPGEEVYQILREDPLADEPIP